MIRPDKYEFNIGRTRYGQPVRLVGERQTSGSVEWRIHRDECSQRDDPQRVDYLTADMIEKMAEAVKGIR